MNKFKELFESVEPFRAELKKLLGKEKVISSKPNALTAEYGDSYVEVFTEVNVRMTTDDDKAAKKFAKNNNLVIVETNTEDFDGATQYIMRTKGQ